MTAFSALSNISLWTADSTAYMTPAQIALSTPIVFQPSVPLFSGNDSVSTGSNYYFNSGLNPFASSESDSSTFFGGWFSNLLPSWTPTFDLNFTSSSSDGSQKLSLFDITRRKSSSQTRTYNSSRLRISGVSYSRPSLSNTSKTDGKHKIYTQTVNGYKLHTYGWVDVNGLKQETKNKLVALAKEAEKHGYTLVASDCYRSHSAQASGVKKKNGGATKWCAPVGKSPHEYGCAFDLVLLNEKGQVVNIKNVSWFHQYATNTLGLDWGQNWKSKKEPWHFNLANWQYRSDVRSQYLAYNGKLPNGQRA